MASLHICFRLWDASSTCTQPNKWVLENNNYNLYEQHYNIMTLHVKLIKKSMWLDQKYETFKVTNCVVFAGAAIFFVNFAKVSLFITFRTFAYPASLFEFGYES